MSIKEKILDGIICVLALPIFVFSMLLLFPN